ncbi:hypothetical protein [Pseudomonas sp. Marseille-Q0931]|nr:hypothetical protein [Pseudomonas sp. Marseille-Q0931]
MKRPIVALLALPQWLALPAQVDVQEHHYDLPLACGVPLSRASVSSDT